jgi:hypothetical protein
VDILSSTIGIVNGFAIAMSWEGLRRDSNMIVVLEGDEYELSWRRQ